MELSVEERIEALEEASRVMLVALGEQLDIRRLLVALKKQHDAYAPTHPAIAEHILRVGRMLSDVEDLRSARDDGRH